MGSRYFLTTFLPLLQFGKAPEMCLDEVIFYANLNLSARDMRIVNLLHTFFDIENVCYYLLGAPMRAYGSLHHRELQEKIEEEDLTLPGMAHFFSLYPTRELRQKNALKAMRFFLEEAPPSLPQFIYSYFTFEYTSRLVTAHLRAQSMGKSFTLKTEEFNFDDTKTWPEPYLELLTIWNNRPKEARKLDQALSLWKFKAVEWLCAHSKPFSLDFFLSYLIRLRILESQEELQDPIHLNIIERIAKARQ